MDSYDATADTTLGSKKRKFDDSETALPPAAQFKKVKDEADTNGTPEAGTMSTPKTFGSLHWVV